MFNFSLCKRLIWSMSISTVIFNLILQSSFVLIFHSFPSLSLSSSFHSLLAPSFQPVGSGVAPEEEEGDDRLHWKVPVPYPWITVTMWYLEERLVTSAPDDNVLSTYVDSFGEAAQRHPLLSHFPTVPIRSASQNTVLWSTVILSITWPFIS